MPDKHFLSLVPPGKRRNRTWYVRGKHPVTGASIEESTGEISEEEAKRHRAILEASILSEVPEYNPVTYGQAAERYILDRPDMAKWEALVHRRIQHELTDDLLTEINQSTVFRIAKDMYAEAKASTKNRWVVRPIAAVMHYAADLGWCGWVRFKKFRQDKPKTRAVTKDVAKLIIEAAGKEEKKRKIKRALCLWMFKHGNRISEILSVKGVQIDAKAMTFEIYISKTKSWKKFALDEEAFRGLKEAYQEGLPEGAIFPWRTRWGVYKWLLPMCRGIGISFSPHMARHSVGTWFSQQGASMRTTMERLGHDDMKSSMRYQAGDIEIVRQMNRKIGNLGGNPMVTKSKRKR